MYHLPDRSEPAADIVLRDVHQAGEHVLRGMPPSVQRAHLPEEAQRPERQWSRPLVLREVHSMPLNI